MAAGKVEMTQEDKAYFKNGVKTLCGMELIFATKVINEPDIKKIFTQKTARLRGFLMLRSLDLKSQKRR